MNWTKDMDVFMKEAEKGGHNIFLPIEPSKETYWCDASEDNESAYVGEYGFDKPIELVGILDRIELKRYSRLLAMSAFKNKIRAQKESELDQTPTHLPEYIYNF